MTHSHGSASAQHRGRLTPTFVLTLALFVVQAVGGYVTNSLALLADAGHNFTDVVGIGLALLAIAIAGRPASDGRTFGFLRLEILAAVVNAVLLFGVAAYVIFEAWRRWSDPPEVASGLMLAIALVDPRVWFRLSYPGYSIVLAMLIAVDVLGPSPIRALAWPLVTFRVRRICLSRRFTGMMAR